MTARSQARDEAVAALLGLGWERERIRQALGLSRVLAATLMPPPPSRLRDGCSASIGRPGFFCDAPVVVLGAVYCAAHTHGAVWRP